MKKPRHDKKRAKLAAQVRAERKAGKNHLKSAEVEE